MSLRAAAGVAHAAVSGANAAKSDGLWLASCYSHTGDYKGGSAHSGAAVTRINGSTIMDVIGDWFFERNARSHRVVDQCGELPCNPTCPH